MTQDEIIEMAKQTLSKDIDGLWLAGTLDLEAFAKLVEDAAFVRWAAQTKLAVQDERAACEKACANERNDPDDQFKNWEDTHDDGWIDGCNSCIATIRARGEA
jgi:hypothetical protein